MVELTIADPLPGAAEEAKFPYWRSNYRTLSASALCNQLGFNLAWPFVPLMVRGLGVETHLERWIGYMLLVFYIIGFIINPIWGGLADHHGRKVMILRASLGMGICMLMIPFATTPFYFACLFMLVGIFNGSTAAINSLLVANTPSRRIGTALSLTQTGSLIGRTLGPAAGAGLAAIVDHYHWMFWISGGFLLISGIMVVFFVHEVKQLAPGVYRPHWIGDLRELIAVPRVAPLFFLCFLFATLSSGTVTTLSIFTLQLMPNDRFGFSEAFWTGAVAISLSVSSLVLLPMWGRILDRHDPARVLSFAILAAIITNLPLLILQTPTQLVLARAAFGLTTTAMLPAIVTLLKNCAPKGMDARAISYATSFQFIALGLAPFCAGLIGPAFGLKAYFGLNIVLTCGGLALWLATLKNHTAANA